MEETVGAQPLDAVSFNATTARDSWTDYVPGKPERFQPPAVVASEQATRALVEDREEHLDMFPARGGVHAPGVPRYETGFRNWQGIQETEA